MQTNVASAFPAGRQSANSLPLGHELRNTSKYNAVAQAMERYPAVITHVVPEDGVMNVSSNLSILTQTSSASLFTASRGDIHTRPLFVREVPTVPISLQHRLAIASTSSSSLPPTFERYHTVPRQLARSQSFSSTPINFARDVLSLPRPMLREGEFNPPATLLEMTPPPPPCEKRKQTSVVLRQPISSNISL